MRVQFANDSLAESWDAYVDSAEDATFYHCYAWKRAMEDAYGSKTFYLMAEDAGTVRGVLPLAVVPGWFGGGALVSIPYANYGGAAADDADVRQALMDEAAGLLSRSGCDYLELKQLRPGPVEGWVEKLEYHTLVLPLAPDPDEVWRQRLNTKVRNQTRKAMKQNMDVRIGTEQLANFLKIYRRNLRDLGTPPHSARWYARLADLFRDRMTAVVVFAGGQPVAGAWLFFFRDTVLLHAAASLRHARGLCPNNLVYWKAIEWACRAGYGRMDFCRSRVGAGTYHFKRQWGAEPRQIFYVYRPGKRRGIPDVNPGNPRYKPMVAAWRMLPLGLANALGPIVRRRITT